MNEEDKDETTPVTDAPVADAPAAPADDMGDMAEKPKDDMDMPAAEGTDAH